MRLRRAYADFLALQRVAHVATADSRGGPHVVPVCLVVERGRLYFAPVAILHGPVVRSMMIKAAHRPR